MLDVHTQGWGWTGVIPGSGLLPEEFPDAYLQDVRPHPRRRHLLPRGHRDPARALLRDDGRLPRRRARAQTVLPPGTLRRQHGHPPDRARLDAVAAGRRSTARCSPAATRTAPRATARCACTAIESPMFGALRFTLEKGRSIPAPQFRTPAPLTPRVDSAPFFGTTGVGGDLYAAAQDAIRAMIDHLGGAYGARARGRVPALQPRRRPQDLRDRRRRPVHRQRARCPRRSSPRAHAATNGAVQHRSGSWRRG